MTVTDNGQLTVAKSTEDINRILSDLAGATQAHESVASGIRNHAESYYAKPEPRSYQEMADIASAAAEEERLIEPFLYTFNYRPWDVALALHRVCKEVYGATPTSIKGKTGQIELPVAHGETITIPYGTMKFVPLGANGTVTTDDQPHPKYGVVGVLRFDIQRKLHGSAKGLCKLIEQDLQVNSIYKGKAVTSDFMPLFLDPYTTNRENIIWTRDVDAALRGTILNVIRYPERARERGMTLHRNLLFEGEPGNGKTETIQIIAQECVENGVTFIMSTTKNLPDALNLARTYAPAVVALEDIERLVNDANANAISNLLEELDGASSKGKEIMLVATTNFVDDLRKTVRRRMAKEVTFGPFDTEACERFLKVKLRGQVNEEEFDYARVAHAMNGWGNSYISKAVEFATGLALEHEQPWLTTSDVLDAVAATSQDWQRYLAAKARPEQDKVSEVLKELVVDAVTSKVKFEVDEDAREVVLSKRD